MSGFTEAEKAERAEKDRLRYHNPDGVYRSAIGMYDERTGETVCCGCWWCEGPITDAHRRLPLGQRDPAPSEGKG